MTARWRTVAVGLALVLGASACSDDPATSAGSSTIATTDAPSTTTSAPSTSVDFEPGARYVSIGSSFAAGAGIPNQLPDCGRSDRSYPRLVAEALELDLVDVSCSGATTANLADTPQGDLPPQSQAVSAEAALVTITAGGNDIGYALTALQCGLGDKSSCPSQLPDDFEAKLEKLHQDFAALIERLQQQAPEATIVLVTYPRLVVTEACPALSFSPEAAVLLGSMGERLQQAFLAVAEETDIRVADPYSVGEDHGPCAPDDERWIDGQTAVAGFPYHPNANGHVAMADLVERILAES